jgi:cell wall-associated NlpC family hydrolase
VSVGILVQRVGEALGRAHALFGDSPVSSYSAGSPLAGAGDGLRAAQGRMTGQSGEWVVGYRDFVSAAGPALARLAGVDDRLGSGLVEAGDADRSGRGDSGAVVDGAAADVGRLGPVSNTPAGERALIAGLRFRVAQQQRVVAAYRLRDGRLAALLRTLIYARGGVVGGGGGGFQIPYSAGGLRPALPGVVPFGGATEPVERSVLVRPAAPAREAPAGPGAAAAEAALSKLGCPYVYGATGPSTFDCSGLTQWSWARAGVSLGRDTYAQIAEGVPVAPGDVRAGDLIFPTSAFGEDGRPGPGHVQLAISPTHVVEAPHTGAVVRVEPMPAAFVARRPLAAR